MRARQRKAGQCCRLTAIVVKMMQQPCTVPSFGLQARLSLQVEVDLLLGWVTIAGWTALHKVRDVNVCVTEESPQQYQAVLQHHIPMERPTRVGGWVGVEGRRGEGGGGGGVASGVQLKGRTG